MLKIVNLKTEAPEVEHPFDFKLDPFQKHAISAISNDENVLVTAKTGSGKTLVGEFQIHHSLKKGKRVFYTTPIKSLSNQKFHDLKKMFPSVGIMTGDIKFAPQADVVIMTTEILRNLLFKQGTTTESVGITAELSLANLDAVIFDEVHYITDKDRGKVWEECLTMLPREVNLVLLSATISRPENFAKWLGDIKQKPIHLISTEYRIVPLVHVLPDGGVVMDSKNVFNKDVYIKWVNKCRDLEQQEFVHKQAVRSREAGQDVVKRGDHITSFVDRMNKLITTMELPALFFVFSRKLCSKFASLVSQSLIDSSDAASVRHIVKFHLHRYPFLLTTAQYNELIPLLEKGVAYHHSGMLPVLKEIVEILFSRGFIKVLFATETFAVGINMPTKAVVFTSYRKVQDGTDMKRMLTPSEYTQMAGRAGRRGKDDKGIVIYLPISYPESVLEVQTMMTGVHTEVHSQMDFHYSYILSSLQAGKNLQTDSYWATERIREIESAKEKIEEERKKIVVFDDEIAKERYEIETQIQMSVNAEKKKHQADLSRWKNKYFQPKWDEQYKQYKENIRILKHIEFVEQCIKHLEDFEETIRLRKIALTTTEYIEDGKLTQKGVLASEIHEGHPLLMAHAYVNRMIGGTQDDIIRCLSVFLEDPRTDEYIPKTVIHHTLDGVSKMITDAEALKSDFSYWELTSYWADPVTEWINGEDHVCDKYGIEQGNFVRAMLKLGNIVDEWVNMATISQDVEIVEKMIGARNRVVRGVVVPDSLYLRI
jgi:superfamily II RNA helicase